VIIAQREARNVRISFQLSMTIKLDPPGSRQGVPVVTLSRAPSLSGRHRCWGALLYSLIASGVVTPTDTTRRLPSWPAVSTEHHTRPDRGQPGGRVRERADVHVAEHLAVRAILRGVRGSRDSVVGEVAAGAAGSSTAVRRSQACRTGTSLAHPPPSDASSARRRSRGPLRRIHQMRSARRPPAPRVGVPGRRVLCAEPPEPPALTAAACLTDC
jgi:hypothetical protein